MDRISLTSLGAEIAEEQQRWDSTFLMDGSPSLLDTSSYAHWCILQLTKCLTSGAALIDLHRQFLELHQLRHYRWYVYGLTGSYAVHGAVALASCILDDANGVADSAPYRAVFDAAVYRIELLQNLSSVYQKAYPVLRHLQSLEPTLATVDAFSALVVLGRLASLYLVVRVPLPTTVSTSSSISTPNPTSSATPTTLVTRTSTSTTATPTPTCFPKPPTTNYVKNPGFDYDAAFDTSMAYWKVSQVGGAYSDASWVYANAGQTTRSNGFKGVTQTGSSGKLDSTLTLSQSDVALPAGAMVEVSAWVDPIREKNANNKAFSITLMLDGEAVYSFAPSSTSDKKISGRVAVKSGIDAHTLALVVRTQGVDGKDIFAADDFAIKVVSGANGLRLCTR
ncbi:unnamed protein product [Alternaria alternata]